MPTKKLSFGVVGLGGRWFAFGRNIRERTDVEIVALCDINNYRLKNASDFLGGTPRLYNAHTDMLANEALDGVIVTSPDSLHVDHACSALKAGADVLVDKPLATTVEGCRKILDAARDAGKTVMIGFNLRHNPVLKRLKEIVDSGTLGRIFLIENREFYSGGRTYMCRWNRHYQTSGGLWVHKGSHDFDVFNWLLGFPKPVKVNAFAGIDVLNPDNLPFELVDGKEPGPTCHECAYKLICKDRYNLEENPEWGEDAAKEDGYYKDTCIYMSEKDVHDNGIAMVEYENGVKASHMECFVTSASDRRYTVIGTRGQAEVSTADREILIRPRWSKETILHRIPKAEGGHGGADPHLVEAFIDVVKGECPNTSTAEHGMLSTAIGQAAEISRREGRLVYLDSIQ